MCVTNKFEPSPVYVVIIRIATVNRMISVRNVTESDYVGAIYYI